MHKLKKQPNETFVGVSIDFAARLADGETLASGTVVGSLTDGTEGTGNDLTITEISAISTNLVATIAGGYDQCIYKVTYTATGSLGNILESEIKLTVKEV